MTSGPVPREDVVQKLMNGLTALADFLPEQVSQERFELGRSGWWSPGLIERTRKRAREYNEQLDSEMSRQQFSSVL
jgi:hypothetical protein